MGAPGGNALRTRRIGIRGHQLAPSIVALAEAQGHTVVDDTPDLWVVEANDPSELADDLGDCPVLVLAPRRLRASHVEAFQNAGATTVLGTNHSVLDVAFAFADLLFDSMCAQRKYARQFGGPRVMFRATDSGRDDRSEGLLAQLARAGTYVLTEDVEPPGTPIEMKMQLGGRAVSLLGRVTCQVGHEDRRGFGVEFALDASDVAPRLADLVDVRPTSSVPATEPLRA